MSYTSTTYSHSHTILSLPFLVGKPFFLTRNIERIADNPTTGWSKQPLGVVAASRLKKNARYPAAISLATMVVPSTVSRQRTLAKLSNMVESQINDNMPPGGLASKQGE